MKSKVISNCFLIVFAYCMGTLHDFIERIHLEAQNDDSIIRGKKRIWIKDYAIEGLGELNMTFANHVLGMNVQIGAS